MQRGPTRLLQPDAGVAELGVRDVVMIRDSATGYQLGKHHTTWATDAGIPKCDTARQ